LSDWALSPVVAALQTMQGMALVYAVTLIAERGDLSRFGNPRQLTAYLGLVPSEQSSGPSVKRGGITKARNAAVVYPDRFIVRLPQVRALYLLVAEFSGRGQLGRRVNQVAGPWTCKPPRPWDRR
jgi:Transposase IS116/IS110/IS902 family